MFRRTHASFFALSMFAALTVSACARKPDPAEVTVSLAEAPGALSSATVLIDYSQASATPLRSGGEPSCAPIVPNVTADFSDDGQGRITMHARAPQGFSAPIDLAVCRMVADAPGVTGDTIGSRLRVSLVAGSDMAGKPLDEQRIAHAGRMRAGEPRDGRGHADDGGREHRQPAERAPRAEAPAMPADAEDETAGQADEADQHEAVGDDRLAAVPPSPAAPKPDDAPSNKLLPERAPDAPGGAPGASSGGDTGGDAGDGGEPGRADSNEESDTDRAARAYAVTVGVTNAAGRLGALQFDIVHRGGTGGFAGAAGSARCSAELPAALATFNDRGNGTVSGALVDLNGIDTPGRVATCTFKSRDSVSAGDFSIQVVDAADAEGEKPPQDPQMSVMDLRALQ